MRGHRNTSCKNTSISTPSPGPLAANIERLQTLDAAPFTPQQIERRNYQETTTTKPEIWVRLRCDRLLFVFMIGLT
jgi:hypothetical protein